MKQVVEVQFLLDGLVKNAVDFLRRSISDFDTSPKHSLIGFTNALELFLKSRLMVEHWSLVLEKPEHANLSEFKKGNIKTVGMEKLVARIEDITGQPLTKPAKDSFEALRKQRNQLVHFFDPEFDNSATVRQNIEKQQCVAWFHLHNLMIGSWSSVFQAVESEIRIAEALMKNHNKYLAIRFDELKDEIATDKATNGAVYWTCPSCGFDSLREEYLLENYRAHHCLVCGIEPNSLTLPCPDCQADAHYWGEGDVLCPNTQCGRTISAADIQDSLQTPYTGGSHRRYAETLIEPAICEECEVDSVMPFHDQYLCTNCLKLHDCIYHCDYCGTLCTGKSADSAWAGCLACDGRVADMKDD